MTSGHAVERTDQVPGPESQFDRIAFLYDELMTGVPYHVWVGYLQRILKRAGCRPRTVLDLCCGTGSVGLLLAAKGYRVSGVDISPEMVEMARRKSEAKGVSVDYHVQDASSLDLGRRFDAIISLFDSLNYILEPAALRETFRRVSEHLESGGLLIFDVNTELALAGGLFDQSNVGSSARVRYDWRSSYDVASRICSIRMTFLHNRMHDEDRVELLHYQRAYDVEEIVEMLDAAELQVLGVYNAYTFDPATTRSDRVFFVAQKRC